MDENANPTDAVVDDAVDEPVVDLPSEVKQTPSPEPKMLTEKDAEELANKRHSKLDKRIAELEKSLAAASITSKADRDALSALRKQAEEAERKAIGDSPDALSLFEARSNLRKEQESLAAQQAEWKEAIEEAKQYKVLKLADEVASEHGVDATLLVSLTDGSKDKMEKLAKSLPKKTADDKPNLVKPPDSGRKSTALGKPTLQQLENMTADQYAAYVAERDQTRRR